VFSSKAQPVPANFVCIATWRYYYYYYYYCATDMEKEGAGMERRMNRRDSDVVDHGKTEGGESDPPIDLGPRESQPYEHVVNESKSQGYKARDVGTDAKDEKAGEKSGKQAA
jgi:hypothetical protein